MARLAIAIDAFIDIWQLADGWLVDAAIAEAMICALGSDVLVYRNTEMQGAYFGMARLLQISAMASDGIRKLLFDHIRMFTVELVHPEGLTMLSRLQYLDDAEFASIVRQGRPKAVEPRSAFLPTEELEQQQLVGAPVASVGLVEGVIGTFRRETQETCALTGERVGPSGKIAVVWPKGGESALDTRNLLFLTPDADDAFQQGHFSALDDFSVLLNMTSINRQLLARINPTGRLLVPVNRNFQPSPEALSFHRHFVFRLAGRVR